MKIKVETLGCKVNQYESELIREQFIKAGCKEGSKDQAADICIVNTCTVTTKTDAESRRLIRKLSRENPNSKIVVTGCYAELDKKEIEKISNSLLIFPNSEKHKISEYLTKEFNKTSGAPIKKVPDAISRFKGRTKAFVKVQDGCDNFCSYCKVPLVRGRSRSRPSDEIINEIKQIVLNGYKEVILTGICLGDWGKGHGLRLNQLLDEIENKVKGEFRLRLSSIEPWYISKDLLQRIATSNKICRHLHIPIQSGDSQILKKMGRGLSAQDFLNLINSVRSLIPELAFTTDILVGFPGEKEEHFENTLEMVNLTRPSRSHIFPFSMREGTRAALLAADNVPDQIVKARINRLRPVTDKLANEYKRRFIGNPVQVLVETKRDKNTNLLVGYTDTYIKLAFDGPDELRGVLKSMILEDSFLQEELADERTTF